MCYDNIITLIFIITIILLILYVCKYYLNIKIKVVREHFAYIDKKEDILFNKEEEKEEDKKDKIIEEPLTEEEIKEIKDEREEPIKRNDGEQFKRRYYLNDNNMLNQRVATDNDELKPSYLMIDQLLDDNLNRYYRYISPKPIKDTFMKKGYNEDEYGINCKYSLNPLEYVNDDLSKSINN